jgi:hypothetical protein
MIKTLIKIEELFYFLLAIFLFSRLDFAWWWYPLLFFAPDIGMLGYLHNNKTGAIVYNFIHLKAVAITIYISGALLGNQILQLAALVMFGHASLDRVLGYGLKYADSFNHTSSGIIGKALEGESQ